MPILPPDTYKITLVGCGKMGGAMLRSWITNNIVHQVDIIKPGTLPDTLKNDPRIKHFLPNDPAEINSDMMVIAVKPQILKEACEPLVQKLSPQTPVLSIAAGLSLKALQSIFGNTQPIIRTMPNTPASIGKGVNVSIANNHIIEKHELTASALLEATGISRWIKDESLMDSVTALSGSGPAYVFLLIEILAQVGADLGLSKDDAMILARQTVIGSAALADYDHDVPASTLRENVTSKGGTTQEALNVLMDGRLENLFKEALTAGQKRAKELNT